MLFGSQDKKLNKYTDPLHEFSNRELKLSEWWLRHEIVLKKTGLGMLLAFCIITIVYSFGYWAYYLGYGYWQDEQMAVAQNLQFENYDNLKKLTQPREAVFSPVSIYNSASEELYDLNVMVNNPNDRWLLGLAYKYVYSGGETEVRQVVVMPQSQTPLAFQGLKSEGYPEGAHLEIVETHWLKLSPHVWPDPGAYLKERVKFLATDFKYSPLSRVEGVPANMITFSLKNDSAYSFWTADFQVMLVASGQPVGVLYLSLDKLKAGEVRPVDLRSFVSGQYVDEVVLYPLVNVFDSQVFMGP